MNEPILEALSFDLSNTDLDIESVKRIRDNTSASSSYLGEARAGPSWQNSHPSSSPTSSVAGGSRQGGGTQQKKNSKSILPSITVLGEDRKTPCIIPGCQFISEPFNLKENKDTYLAHLLAEHRIVIDDVNKIANLYKYAIHWKSRLESCPIKEFCVGFVMDEIPEPPAAGGRKGKRNKEAGESETEGTISTTQEKPVYYMLSPVLPEDKELREKIWNSRLEAVLEVNRQEREQQDFSRQCVLCRDIFTGNRTIIFDHMIKDHSFHVGKPDNIVFVEEFLELIAEKLNKLICLHCEKVFKDKPALRDHMRKKGHKRLNSDNPEYDRYYTVNYLEPGKDWRALEKEDAEDERTEEDWVEAHEESTNIVCLFCSYQSPSFDEVLGHMKMNHRFNFLETTVQCDFYQKVKIVNFIRRRVFLNTCLYCEKKFLERTSLLQHILEHEGNDPMSFPSARVWDQPEYYFPTYENDQFLVLLDNDSNQEDCSMISSNDEDEHVIPEDHPLMNLENRRNPQMDLT